MPQSAIVDLVLSVTAHDRAGIVKALSQTINDHNGNWIDSSMARLGGEFAGILQISVAEASVRALQASLGELETQGIHVTTRQATTSPPPGGHRAKIELTGLDHPGIVHQISSALARHHVSIDELHTQVFAGSMTGTRHFSAKSIIMLPDGLDVEELRDVLEQIATDIMVDITLS